jgi:three-Cys-motif partner protein
MRGWSRHKLEYLTTYITSYRSATQKAFKTFYIDGFSGPGRLPDEETGQMVDGSPLVALKAAPPFTACFLIELNAQVARRLKSEVSGFRNAHVILGDANTEIPRVLGLVNDKSPTLVVLDPTGVIGQVRWSTVEAVSRKRTELFINFPYHMAVQRILPNNQSGMTTQRVSELDGYLPPGWQDVYVSTADKGRRMLCRGFLELYRDQLRKLGYTHVFASSAFRTDTGMPLYYLVWAGKNPIGAKIAKHVLLRQFAPQSIRLLNTEDDDWIA